MFLQGSAALQDRSNKTVFDCGGMIWLWLSLVSEPPELGDGSSLGWKGTKSPREQSQWALKQESAWLAGFWWLTSAGHFDSPLHFSGPLTRDKENKQRPLSSKFKLPSERFMNKHPAHPDVAFALSICSLVRRRGFNYNINQCIWVTVKPS